MVRYQWIIGSTLAVLAVGCVSPMGSGGKSGSSKPQATKMSLKSPSGQKGAKPSFVQQVAAMNPFKGSQQAKPPKTPITNPKTDPIALANPTGPPTADLYVSMAELGDRGGNVDHARTMYQKALVMEPNHLGALLGLARLEDRQGNLSAALQVYQRTAAAHPQNPKALNDLALCHARNGDLQESLSVLSIATRLEPKKPLYRNNIAKVLIELNRPQDAMANLAAVHPPAIAQFNMGVLLMERGRLDESKWHLAEAKRLDPSLSAADQLLAQIEGTAQPQSTGGIAATAPASPSATGARYPATNDDILPTPMTPPGGANAYNIPAYPSTGAQTLVPPQTVPGMTARLPVTNPPALLPPTR